MRTFRLLGCVVGLWVLGGGHANAQLPPAPYPNPLAYPPLPDPGPVPVVTAWPANGVPLCTAPGEQDRLTGTNDYAHGAYFAWNDRRGLDRDVYATRIGPDGQPVAGWGADGNLVAGGSGDQFLIACVNDGPGGTFIAWIDQSSGAPLLYVQRLTDRGEVAPGWPAGGRRVCTNGTQRTADVYADRQGGLQFAWAGDIDSVSYISAYHMGPDGVPYPGWSDCGIRADREYTRPPGCVSGREQYFSYGTSCWPDGMFIETGLRAEDCEEHRDPQPTCICQSAGCWHKVYFHAPDRTLFETQVGCYEDAFFQSDDAGGFLVLSPAGVDRVGVLGNPSWTFPGVFPYWGGRAYPAGDGSFYLPWASTTWGYIRLLNDGTLAPGWSLDTPAVICVPPCTASGTLAWLVPDGTGGVFLAWGESRAGLDGVYGGHLLADGRRDPSLPGSGFPMAEGATDAVVWPVIADRRGSVIVGWSDTHAGNRNLYANRLTIDTPVAVAASLIATWSSPDRVEIEWSVPSDVGGLEVLRREDDDVWRVLTWVAPDGVGRVRLVDRDVQPGSLYHYRLSASGRVLNEVSIEVPVALRLSLDGARPNPSSRGFDVFFALPDERDVVLRLTDVAGRLVQEQALGPTGPGQHSVAMGRPGGLAPGTYFIELRAGATRAVRRAIVIR